MFVLMTLYHSAQKSRSIRPLWRVITSTGDIFQFLASLPNLQVLYIGELVPRHLSRFISSTRHTALFELLLVHLLKDRPPKHVSLAWRNFTIYWDADVNLKEPGSSLAYFYELNRPSLTTLVELDIKPWY